MSANQEKITLKRSDEASVKPAEKKGKE